MQNKSRLRWMLVGVGVALVCLVLFRGAAKSLFGPKAHTVTLTWKASTSAVEGYNVYRRVLPSGSFVKINGDSLVYGQTFVDTLVQSGVRYEYVVRASAHGQESGDSGPAVANVP